MQRPLDNFSVGKYSVEFSVDYPLKFCSKEERSRTKINFGHHISELPLNQPTSLHRYGYPSPVYVNVVRDPVERVISWYYYVRAPWYYVERKRAFPDLPLPDPAWLKKVCI